MKISKNEISRFINEAAKPPKNWNDYIAVGKNAEQKKERSLIQQRWEKVGGNQKLYKNFNDLKASPGNFDKSFMGWVKWYNTCRKDAAAMRLIDKKPGSHFSPAEMIKLYAKMIPGGKLAKAKKAVDSEAVASLLGAFDDNTALADADDAFDKIMAITNKKDSSEEEEEEFSFASTKPRAKPADDADLADEDDEDDENKPGYLKRLFRRKSDEKELAKMNESIKSSRWQKLANL